MDREAPSRIAWPSFWDLAYRHGDHLEGWESSNGSPELMALLAEGAISAGDRVLDLGCGAGPESVLLAAAGCRVLGIDRSLTGLSRARDRQLAADLSIDWVRGDVAALPLASASIAAAIDRGCLHVLSRSRRPGYARSVARVLVSGGLLLLRGAAADDEEAGVLGLGAAELDRLFPSTCFERGPRVPLALVADGGCLEGVMAVLRRR